MHVLIAHCDKLRFYYQFHFNISILKPSICYAKKDWIPGRLKEALAHQNKAGIGG